MRQEGPTEDDGLISFDVRSLQEFMAAAELTTETDSEDGPELADGASRQSSARVPKIEDRLIHIAGMAHWRHVFLIAASRCFTDTALHHLRSVVVSIPRTLDTAEPDRSARMGARLALDMLADGIGINHPISRKKLIEHAMELLELGPEAFDNRLTTSWSEETEDILKDRLLLRLNERDTAAALSAWRLVFNLCSISPDTFVPVAKTNWPRDPDVGLKILSALRRDIAPSPPPLEELIKLITYSVKLNAPSVVFRIFARPRYSKARSETDSTFTSALRQIISFASDRLFRLFETDRDFVRIPVLDQSIFTFIRPVLHEPLRGLEQHIADWSGGWAILSAAAEFGKSPSAAALAGYLRKVGTTGTLREAQNLHPHLPWPLRGTICCAADAEELEKFAVIAETGGFGDKEAWLAAEKRWTSAGIRLEDLRAANAHGPFGREVASIGAPLIDLLHFEESERLSEAILKLIEACALLVNRRVGSQIAHAISWSLSATNPPLLLDAEHFFDLLEGLSDLQWLDLKLLAHLDKTAFRSKRVTEFVSHRIANARHLWFEARQIPVADLVSAFNCYSYCRPILYAIAGGCLDLESNASAAPPDGGELLGRLPSSAFDWQGSDEPCTAAGVAALRIMKDQKSTSAEISALTSEPDLDLRVTLAKALADRFSSWERVSQGDRTTFLVNLRAGLADRAPLKAPWLYEHLTRELDARKSGMFDRATWVDQLRLPQDAFEILSRPA
jgi:hypothetical protein